MDAPITVQQRFCVRIFLKRLLEGVQHKRRIIAAAQGERNDIPSVQIQHSTQVRFLKLYGCIMDAMEDFAIVFEVAPGVITG